MACCVGPSICSLDLAISTQLLCQLEKFLADLEELVVRLLSFRASDVSGQCVSGSRLGILLCHLLECFEKRRVACLARLPGRA